jgi:hypothetical protein
MPTHLKNYFDNNQKETEELFVSVAKEVTGGATGPVSMEFYVIGVVAALVGGVAMAL